MVMKYDSIMADWLSGSGEHQPGRARARTAAQPPGPGSNTQGRALHRSAETLQISWRARMETGRNNIRCSARGCPSHHHPAPCVPVLCRSGWWWRVMRAGWARCWAGAPPRPVMSIVKCNNAVTCTAQPAYTAYSATFYNNTQHYTEIT